MNDILYINEEFFKRNVSHRQSFDSNQVISSIRLVQKTNLISIISEPIYDMFQDKLLNSTAFSEAEEKLYATMQLFLAVKVAEELIYAAPRADDNLKDGSHLTYRNKSTLMEARMVRDINRDETLLALAQSGAEEYDDAEMDTTGGFYFA